MQHYRINRVSLLKFEQELLHGLNGVVTTQIDHYFLNLEMDRKHKLVRHDQFDIVIFVSRAKQCTNIHESSIK